MTEPSAPFLSPETKRAFYRALLRAIPIVPGPELLDILDAARRSRESVDAKVAQVLESLQTASSLIDDLELSLKDRTEKLTALREQVERYSALAEVEENKAKAILTQLDITIQKSQGKERWISLVINLVAGLLIFLLGIALGPQLTSWWQGRPSTASPSGAVVPASGRPSPAKPTPNAPTASPSTSAPVKDHNAPSPR